MSIISGIEESPVNKPNKIRVPPIIDMLVAIYTTKIPILIKDGFWDMAHEARTDFAMLFCLLFILINSLSKSRKQLGS